MRVRLIPIALITAVTQWTVACTPGAPSDDGEVGRADVSEQTLLACVSLDGELLCDPYDVASRISFNVDGDGADCDDQADCGPGYTDLTDSMDDVDLAGALATLSVDLVELAALLNDEVGDVGTARRPSQLLALHISSSGEAVRPILGVVERILERLALLGRAELELTQAETRVAAATTAVAVTERSATDAAMLIGALHAASVDQIAALATKKAVEVELAHQVTLASREVTAAAMVIEADRAGAGKTFGQEGMDAVNRYTAARLSNAEPRNIRIGGDDWFAFERALSPVAHRALDDLVLLDGRLFRSDFQSWYPDLFARMWTFKPATALRE